MSLATRVKNAWNAFVDKQPENNNGESIGFGSYRPPHSVRMHNRNERSIINAVYNRIAIDVSQIEITHAKVDENGHYLEPVNSDLNYALTQEANLDQTSKSFFSRCSNVYV